MTANEKHVRRLSLWQLNSLKVRLVFSAMLVIVLILPIIGFTLNSAFEEQIKSAIKNELSAYSYSILAVAEVSNNELFLPEQLLENQFNVIQSGLYALITQQQGLQQQGTQQQATQVQASNEQTTTIKTEQTLSNKNAVITAIDEDTLKKENVVKLWNSASFFALDLPKNLIVPPLGDTSFSEILIEGTPHLLYSYSVSYTENNTSFPFTLHIIKDQVDFLATAAQFKHQLWMWLAILMALLMFVQVLWLIWTLRPLSLLKNELTAVESGKTARLKGSYPVELEQVTEQLNTLLSTEESQRKRYRNALSDLAHSLKTPLAVIQSQGELSDTSLEQLNTINNTIEYQLKRAQSAGQSSWHLGIEVSKVVDKLVNTLNKIYRNNDILIKSDVCPELIFKGDEADLMELLGNLLDNACKAAKHTVFIGAKREKHGLEIIVADDGSGVEDDLKQAILQRGTRADTYQSGHGIGLAIVKDLVKSYHGSLSINSSALLGGAEFKLYFKQ
ncbi:ATP-binding protein [Colwelliaceae bacterium 6471]